MRSRYTKQQKFDLIMECRNSGLSDYQWCKANHVSSSTFYGWTQQLKKSGVQLPECANIDTYAPSAIPDVVKLEISPDVVPTKTTSVNAAQSINNYAVEITLGEASIKISNDVSHSLLSTIIACIGGSLC